MGATEPRLWTPPLRELTPETSAGFNQVRFATNRLNRPPLPWQEFAMVHAGELLPDGRPRFRIVILKVGRQNGKTEIVVILPAYWMFVEDSPLILGTSTKIEYAKETWNKTRKLISASKILDTAHPAHWYVRGNNDTSMWAHAYDKQGRVIPGEQGSRYKIAAANEEGGRSLTIHRAIADELRQHDSFAAWDAMEPACSYWDSQIWATSNEGSDKSVVLNALTDQAMEYIEHGIGDSRIGLFSWSAAPDADPEDPAAILQANPRVGYGGKTLDDLRAEAAAAVRAGGERLTSFQTEKLCIRVKSLNPAINPGAWLRGRVPGTLDGVRDRLAACLDVSPDGGHVTLAVAAVLPDGRVRGELAGSWDSTAIARADLPELLARIRPRLVGWFPNGPAAALAASMGSVKNGEAIRGDTSASCMGFEELVRHAQFLHSGDLLLDQHVGAAERMKRGDAWVFAREGDGRIDACYAMAGAVHLARTMPAPIGRPRLIVASGD